MTEIGADPGATAEAELTVEVVQMVEELPVVMLSALWVSEAHLLLQ